MGAVIYHMVIGRPPFEGDDPLSIAFKHVHKPPQPPTEIKEDVPADWEELILKMLAKDPADRYQSAAQLEEAISALSEQPETHRASSIEQTTKLAVPLARAISAPDGESAPRLSPDGATKREEERPLPAQARADRPAKAERSPWLLPAGVVALVLAVLIAVGVYLLTASSGGSKSVSTPVPRTRVPSALLVQFGTTGARPGQFSAPQSVAVDRQGNIYVADWGNNRIQKLSGAGTPLTSWGGRRTGLRRRRFNHPSGVALDAQGQIYVADSENNRVKKLSPRGILLEEWGSFGTGPRQFRGLHSVTVDAQGNVYTTDAYNNRIQKFSPSGRVLAAWGKMGSAPGRFNQPVGLAIDAAGNVYVADSKNHRIQKLSPSGKFLTQFKWLGGAGFPKGVALDGTGNIYIADYTHDLIQELSPAGRPIGTWGSRGSGPGQFKGPSSVWVDAQGIVYVADEGNDRIQKFGFGS
jgi:DNA-binding beta-propeller fold protein YncE